MIIREQVPAMEAIIQKFIEDIQHLSVAELRALCAELKRENEDLQSIISVYRNPIQI